MHMHDCARFLLHSHDDYLTSPHNLPAGARWGGRPSLVQPRTAMVPSAYIEFDRYYVYAWKLSAVTVDRYSDRCSDYECAAVGGCGCMRLAGVSEEFCSTSAESLRETSPPLMHVPGASLPQELRGVSAAHDVVLQTARLNEVPA